MSQLQSRSRAALLLPAAALAIACDAAPVSGPAPARGTGRGLGGLYSMLADGTDVRQVTPLPDFLWAWAR